MYKALSVWGRGGGHYLRGHAHTLFLFFTPNGTASPLQFCSAGSSGVVLIRSIVRNQRNSGLLNPPLASTTVLASCVITSCVILLISAHKLIDADLVRSESISILQKLLYLSCITLYHVFFPVSIVTLLSRLNMGLQNSQQTLVKQLYILCKFAQPVQEKKFKYCAGQRKAFFHTFCFTKSKVLRGKLAPCFCSFSQP